MTLQYPREPCREVVVLGAGFSRALAAQMPLTDELGSLAVERAGVDSDPRLPADGFHSGNFETWLSRMAEDQPHLLAADNRSNEVLFLRISEAIHQVLSEHEVAVLGGEAPQWLYVLLSLVHLRRSTVITFNYDTLLECGVSNHHLYDFEMDQRVLADDVINDVPPLLNRQFRYNGSVAETFRLLKLHGALNWFWSTGDATGATLNRWILPGTYGIPIPYDEAARRRQLPGREPFVVPPTATKSAYYANPITRELWRQAAEALLEADHIYLVGYSMPPTDVMFTGMFGDAIRDRDVSIEIVNPSPDELRNRLEPMSTPGSRVSVISGSGCVSAFVEQYQILASHALVRELRNCARDDQFLDVPLVLSWGNPASADPAATGPTALQMCADGSSLELLIEPNPPIGGATAARWKDDGTPQTDALVTLRSLVENLEMADRILAKAADGSTVTLVGAWHAGNNVGYSTRWQVLIPAGQPRRWATTATT